MDAFARGLKIAGRHPQGRAPGGFCQATLQLVGRGIGREIETGKSSFAALEKYMLKKGDPAPNASGRQEFLENLINEFI